MLFFILLVYFENEEEIKKFFKFIEHKLEIQKKNRIFREEKKKKKNEILELKLKKK